MLPPALSCAQSVARAGQETANELHDAEYRLDGALREAENIKAAAVEAYRLAEERVRQVKMDTEERLRLAENETEEMKRRRDS